MFCPVCGAEYEAGVTECADDRATLLESLPPEIQPDLSDAEFVPLHNFGSTPEAEMIVELLLKNNVRAVVQGGGNDAFAALSGITTGATVLVDERDLSRAQELYQNFFGDDVTPLTGEINSAGLDDDPEATLTDYE